MTVSGKLELTIKISEMPQNVRTVGDSKTFDLDERDLKPACSNPKRFDDPYLMVGNSGEESRHKPKRSSSYAGQIMKEASMADFISEIASFPDATVEGSLEPSEALDVLRTHYKTLALGLEYYEIEHEPDRKAELKRQFLFTSRVRLKPDVDLSRAMLAFVEQVWDRSERLQDNFPNAVSLWFHCESSLCQYRLRTAGITGVPDLDDRGKVIGKKRHLQTINRLISDCEKTLIAGAPVFDKSAHSSPLDRKVLFKEHFINYVLAIALQIANSGDSDLDFHIRQFLQAARHHANLTENSESRQICRMHQGKLKVTGKSKKAFKPATERKKSIGFGVRNVTKC